MYNRVANSKSSTTPGAVKPEMIMFQLEVPDSEMDAVSCSSAVFVFVTLGFADMI